MEDQLVLDAPVEATETSVDTAHEEPSSTPVETAAVDDNEAMWGDLKEEPAPDETPAIPEAYTKALEISDYVKEPAHLEQAVKAAQEIWDVQTGKQPVTTILEAFRGSNPQQFEKMVLDQLVPYVEHLTGKRLGDSVPPDPMQEMQNKIRELEQRPIHEAQQREQAATLSRAEEAGGKHIESLISKGNGIFDGDVVGAVQAVSAQFAKLGINPQEAMKQVTAGDFTALEKAYKAAEKAETLRVKTFSDRIRTKYTTLKNSVPKTTASQGTSLDAGNPDLSTKEGRAKAMAAAFAAGRDTI